MLLMLVFVRLDFGRTICPIRRRVLTTDPDGISARMRGRVMLIAMDLAFPMRQFAATVVASAQWISDRLDRMRFFL
jgi:hypothetical protein